MNRQTRRHSAIGSGLIAAFALLGFAVPAADTGAPPECFGKPVTILGDAGDDNLRGTDGRDVIDGRNGENDVRARGGNDFVCGGKDGDDIFGGDGNDKMGSGGSTDFIAGKQGDDVHLGGGGDDQIDAVQDSLATDDDVVRGKKGNDFLDVLDGEDNDSVSGGDGGGDECLADAGDVKSASCEI